VTRYGTRLARAGAQATGTRRLHLPDAASVERLAQVCRALRPAVCHFHFTDQLYGTEPGSAAARFRSLVEATGDAISVVTVHDVPSGHGDGDGLRRAAYRDVAERSDAVIASSRHEASRLGDIAAVVPTVIPHFVELRPRRGVVSRRVSVGVLGYLYPGKGHEDVLASMSERASVAVVAIGGPAPRHPTLADDLQRFARSVDAHLEILGWVGEDRLDRHLSDVTVPVVANEDISASGSLATWLGAHRRPLVRSGPYALEVAERAPGCLTLYDADDPGALTAAISDALRSPSTTWQHRVPAGLRPDRIADRHAALYAALA